MIGNREQVSRFGPLIPSKNFREYHPWTRTNKSMLKQKITLICLHVGNSNSSMLNLLNKMDQENKNFENRFIVQCTLCIFTNKRSANKFLSSLLKSAASLSCFGCTYRVVGHTMSSCDTSSMSAAKTKYLTI